jgi:hypothetical protein
MPAGETEKSPSGLTVDTLYLLLAAKLDDIQNQIVSNDRRYEERFEGQEKAIAKAEAATDRRLEGMNEFRDQLADQTKTYIPRAEAEQRFAEIDTRHHTFVEQHRSDLASITTRHASDVDLINSRHAQVIGGINSRLDLAAGRSSGLDKGWALLVGLIAAAGAVIAIVLNLNP